MCPQGPQGVKIDVLTEDASDIYSVYMWIRLDKPDGNAIQRVLTLAAVTRW